MRLKSKYRQAFRDGGAVLKPDQDKPIEPPIEATSMPPPEAPAPAEPPVPLAPPPENDATLALKRAIENLRHSEQAQRQQQEAIAGAEFRRLEWLAGHPKAQANVHALGQLHHAAIEAGLPDASPEYFSFLESQLNALPDGTPDMPTPEFFKPPPATPARSAAPSAMLSAPVSRTVPTGPGARPRGKVTLSASEVEAARISGLTVEQYAAEKLKYEGMRERGEYRDNRER